MGLSRQEYWSGLPFPSPGDLPNPGIEPRSPTLQADALTSEPPGKLRVLECSSCRDWTRAASNSEGSSKGSSGTWLGGGKTIGSHNSLKQWFKNTGPIVR